MGEILNDRLVRFVEKTSPEHEAEFLEEMAQRMTSRIEGIEGPEGRPESLQAICKSLDIPFGRVMTWLMADAKRYAVYERALEVAAHADASEVVAIADGPGFPQEKRVRIDARKWSSQVHAPEKYGERVRVDNSTVVLVDAGLIGTAGALLDRLVSRGTERYITPLDDDDQGV